MAITVIREHAYAPAANDKHELTPPPTGGSERTRHETDGARASVADPSTEDGSFVGKGGKMDATERITMYSGSTVVKSVVI